MNAAGVVIRSNALRAAAGTVLILLIPLVAMQVSGNWDWNLLDFAVAGVLLFGTGFAIGLLLERVRQPVHRLGYVAAALALFLYVWAELAVGVFTDLGS